MAVDIPGQKGRGPRRTSSGGNALTPKSGGAGSSAGKSPFMGMTDEELKK